MINISLFPEYCKTLSKNKYIDLDRAKQNNKDAVSYMEKLTPEQISKIKTSFSSIKPHYDEIEGFSDLILLANAYSFLENYSYVNIESDLKNVIRNVLEKMSDIKVILNNIYQLKHSDKNYYEQMFYKLAEPYSESIRYLVAIYQKVHNQTDDNSLSLDGIGEISLGDEF